MSSKSKTIRKTKKTTKRKVNLPKQVKKGQITATELKSVGLVTSEGQLKNSAPVEAVAGIGVKKSDQLRAEGIETVGDYKKSIGHFFKEKKPSSPVRVKTSKKEIVPKSEKELQPKKKSRPRKGNEYIIDELVPVFFQKPTIKDWKKEDLQQQLVSVFEAEYGKGSEVVEEFRPVVDQSSKRILWSYLETMHEDYVNEGKYTFRDL